GGTLAGKASDSVLDLFIEDDADKMISIIEVKFKQLAEDYLLGRDEAEHIVDALKENLTGAALKDMFASEDRYAFAHSLLIDHVENEVKKRQKVRLPSEEQMIQGLREVLEEIADEQN